MNNVQKIARSTVIRSVGHILRISLQFIITIIIVRTLGKEDYGKYAVIFAFLFFFRPIIDMGINTFLIREIARDRQKAGLLLGNGLLLKIPLAIIIFTISILIMYSTNYPAIIKTGTLMGAMIILFLPLQVAEALFLADLKQEYPMGVVIFSKITKLALVVWVITSKTNLINLVIISTFCEIIYLVLLYWFVRKHVKLIYQPDVKLFGQILKQSIPFGIAAVSIAIYFKVDAIMLSVMKGDAEVGLYTAAYHYLEVMIIFPHAFLITLFPLFSGLAKTSVDTLLFMFKKSLKYLFTLAIPTMAGLMCISNQLVVCIYGQEFKESAQPLFFLSLAIGTIFIGYLFCTLINSIDRQIVVMGSTLTGMLVNIGVNLLLIPQLGTVGAAIGTCITETFLLAIFYVYIRTKFKEKFFSIEYMKPVFAALVMVFILIIVNNHIVSPGIQILFDVPLAVITYFGMLFLVRWFDKSDRDILFLLINWKPEEPHIEFAAYAQNE